MEYEIGTEESTSTAVVRAVSAVEGRDPLSLRPIGEVLDPDALDSLFDPVGEEAAAAECRLRFVYSKCRVTIEDGKYLTLEPIDPRIQECGPDAIPGAGP